MKLLLSTVSIISTALIVSACHSLPSPPKHQITVPVSAVSNQGIGAHIGTITFSDSKDGLVIQTNLQQIPSGPHGFHIHENPSCEPDIKDGKPGAALKAGSHLDPKQTGKHASPTADGHLGDLPLLTANNRQISQETLLAPRLTLEKIKNRAVVIHAGGDNYSDQPQALGGGGARIACGVIR